MGPIIIFDKSTLQSLSVDEAVWLHSFYLANITPLFFVETLADLQKELQEGRTPEQVVGNLALKTAPFGAQPNLHHLTLCIGELLGTKVEMERLPVSGRQAVVTADGSGLLFRHSAEEEALERWQRSEFLEVERRFARLWRGWLADIDLRRWKLSNREHEKPRTLAEAKELAVRLVDQDTSRYRILKLALGVFALPGDQTLEVVRRWKSLGGPSIREFAPYVAHVLTVDIFFGLSLQAGLISAAQPSNRVDIAYLYYLPFCMVFTSSDKLHERTVPLFLRTDQVFVHGRVLKADLAKLDAHYSALPEEVRKQGVMRFAQHPPTEGDFLATKLWDRLMLPVWRESAAQQNVPLDKDVEKALLELVQKYSEPAGPQADRCPDIATAGGVVLESRVPLQMGKWRLFPPEVERKASRRDRGNS